MTPSYGRKRRGNSLLVQVKEESDKAGLKLNIQKKKIMTSGPLSLLSCVQLFLTPRTAARQVSLSIKNSRACSNSCPSSWWCHLTISSSVVPFSCCLQSFLTSGSFLMSQLFTSGDQSFGTSASTITSYNLLNVTSYIIFILFILWDYGLLHHHMHDRVYD